jgi:hypothetical protein
MRTSALQADGPTKVLLYAHHGYGKTFQCRFYQKRYGKGLILSGESGLKSIEDTDIEFLPFSSWDGRHEPDEGVYSFKGIVRMLHSPEFKAAGYKWIAIDSLTELSERIHEHLEREEAKRVAEGAKPNGFAVWGDYSRLLIGALKWVRDLPIHVFVTCLAKEEKDDNDATDYWPFVKGQAVSKQVPALFDHVFCGLRTTEKDDTGKPRVKRLIVTDEVMGWHGKARDPLNRLQPLEAVNDITELLARMSAKEEGLI